MHKGHEVCLWARTYVGSAGHAAIGEMHRSLATLGMTAPGEGAFAHPTGAANGATGDHGDGGVVPMTR